MSVILEIVASCGRRPHYQVDRRHLTHFMTFLEGQDRCYTGRAVRTPLHTDALRSPAAGGRMKSIRDIVVAQDTVIVEPTATVAAAARVMAERQIGAVPVVDGDRVVGVFSERDALTRVVAEGLDPNATRISMVMSSPLVLADISDSCEACLNRMTQAHVRHLIVLDHDRMAGIVSMRDLMAVDLDDKVHTIALLNEYIHYAPDDAGKPRS
jgi:CBS domain-containing protein